MTLTQDRPATHSIEDVALEQPCTCRRLDQWCPRPASVGADVWCSSCGPRALLMCDGCLAQADRHGFACLRCDDGSRVSVVGWTRLPSA
jgi:hypothetical protein